MDGVKPLGVPPSSRFQQVSSAAKTVAAKSDSSAPVFTGGPTTVRRKTAGRYRTRRLRRGGLLTSTGVKPLMTPATLGTTGSLDTAKASFGPTSTRKAGRKVRKLRKTRRHRK
jgi:hypothetical protein